MKIVRLRRRARIVDGDDPKQAINEWPLTARLLDDVACRRRGRRCCNPAKHQRQQGCPQQVAQIVSIHGKASILVVVIHYNERLANRLTGWVKKLRPGPIDVDKSLVFPPHCKNNALPGC